MSVPAGSGGKKHAGSHCWNYHFLGAHSFTTFRRTRLALIAWFGAAAYKGIYSLVSLIGFVLIIWGFLRYRAEGLIHIWTPPAWADHLTLVLMWFAFVALACMNPAPGRIKGWLRHPMLAGIKVWALEPWLMSR